MGRAHRHDGLRRDRLGGRLSQGRLPRFARTLGSCQVRAAIGNRLNRCDLPRVFGIGTVEHAVPAAVQRLAGQRLQSRSPAQSRPYRSFFQDGELSARRVGFHRSFVLRDRRDQQRSEPDRWARWLGDHADRDDRRRAGHLCLRHRTLRFLLLSFRSSYSRRWGAHCDLRRHRWRGARIPLVQRVSG